MLIPRQQHSNGNGSLSMKELKNSGLEVKPIYKKMPQNTHINQLLNTAAAGNGVIGDVDALLTPLAHSQDSHHAAKLEQFGHNQSGNVSLKERTERNLWRNDEVMEMLFIMQQVKALDKLNDKMVKSENVFKDVEEIMHKKGFVKKSHVQIWTKWKFLKSTYMTSRRNGIVPRMIPQEIYDVLHQMISSQNQGLSECGNSTAGSLDGDSSNAGGQMMTGGGGAIGGVDGGGSANPTDADDSFGMAHPIFGFRLGLVKNEPSDTGYDAVENNEPALDKEILNDKLPKPMKKIKEIPIKENQAKVTLEIPHRGRGRPPKPKNTPMASSTPNSSPVAAVARPNVQLPPLRVAPFAKATNSTNVLAASSRPPPPLTMPPNPRPIRIASLSTLTEPIKNGGGSGIGVLSNKFSQPKLLTKQQQPANQMQAAPQVRLLKDMQSSRASSTPSPSYPKLKQVPMRKTPYSLRPDRVIPDLDESFSPPPSEYAEISHHRYDETIQSNGPMPQNGINRKRRQDWPPAANTVPTKFRRIPSDDEDFPRSDGGQKRSQKEDNRYGKLLQSVIVDLSTSLRKVQTQMMKDFFNKQHELLQREHAFQMQQDRLIMETFQVQTFEIMKSVKDLVGTIAVGRTREEEEYRLSVAVAAAKEANMERKRGRKEKRIFEESQSLQDQRLRDHQQEEEGFEYEEAENEQNEHESDQIYSEEDRDRGESAEQQQAEHEDNTQENEGEANEAEDEELEDTNNYDHHQQSEVLTSQQQQHQVLHNDQSQSLDEENGGGGAAAAEDDDDDDDDEEEDESDSSDSDSDDDDDDNEEITNTQMLHNGGNMMSAAQLMEEEDEEEEDED